MDFVAATRFTQQVFHLEYLLFINVYKKSI